MSFNLENVYRFGDGEIGDVSISDGAYDKINSYARVTAAEGNTITIDLENVFAGDFEKFVAGNTILIHVSSASTETQYLGKYLVAEIQLVDRSILTLDKSLADILPASDFNYYSVQAVTFANFDCLDLQEGAILTPPPFNPFKLYGGILAIKCFDTLKFSGGVINLKDCGIPANRKHLLRPLTEQETEKNGQLDVAKFAGYENHLTAERFLINAGDGAAFIVAKNLVCNKNSRIGNPETHGAQYCRGAKDSVGVKPSNITNIGGSSILIAAENITNFAPEMIAKYRDAASEEGAGLARCYIASETKLPNDEGLYCFDCLNDNLRAQKKIGVKNFGDGSFGNLENPTTPLNNYAHISSISQNGYKLNYTDKTLNGLSPLVEGALVLVQVIQKKKFEHAGDITLAKILRDTGTSFILDFPAPNVSLDEYSMQIISIPQFKKFAERENYKYTPPFDGEKGGVLAVAASSELNICGGKLNVENKGGAPAYGREGLKTIGNAQLSTKLPLGEGHGSVFLLAKNLIMDDNSRIGATYSGTNSAEFFGGDSSDGKQGGGYSVGNRTSTDSHDSGGYILGGASLSDDADGTANLSAEHYNFLTGFNNKKLAGGFGSNGAQVGKFKGGSQGAHIVVIADRIDGFTTNALSTGGEGGHGLKNGGNGSAGYGGGGSTSSGGSSGWAFVYVNETA